MSQPEISYKEYFYDLPIDLFCVINPHTQKIIEANNAFELILGWKPIEIIGRSLTELTQDKTAIDKAFSKVKLGVHSLVFEAEFHTKNNLPRWFDWKCYFDSEKQQVFAIGRDITVYKEAQKSLTVQSHIDHLTGVYDRQTFLTYLQNELNSAVRHHYPTAIILIDIDHFKTYNEKQGMQKADECLRQIATLLKTCLRRKTDFLARYENDTFAVLLTHNTIEKAIQSAEYLRSNLEKLVIRHTSDNTQEKITVSLGVSAIKDTSQKTITASEILNAAQRALHISQRRGGNQVHYLDAF